MDEDQRRCAYRHCRAPLPVSQGRGNRPRYCQDGRTWGTNDLTCKAAEAAFLAVESVQPEDPLGHSVVLDRLGERLGAAAEPLAELLAAVTETRTLVGDATRAALQERDAARAEAAESRGAREQAEARAAAAERAAVDAQARVV